METPLSHIVRAVREHPGLTRKRENLLVAGLCTGGPFADAATAAVGDKMVAGACDAILPELCAAAPRFAGRCAVLAVVNDLAAAGARPLFFLNSLAAPDQHTLEELAGGMAEASELFEIPCGGGHLLPLGSAAAVTAAGVGVLAGPPPPGTVSPGDALILCAALRGGRPPAYRYAYDATFCMGDPPRVRAWYRTLESVFADGLAVAAKDVANAGFAGTLALLLEASRAGARVDLGRVLPPAGLPLVDWLLTFPSFGFALAAAPEDAPGVLARLRGAGLWADTVGEATDGAKVTLCLAGRSATLFDWDKEGILSHPPEA
ncbi:MAG: hypothetical protein JRI97_13130 [Deltaproteobacteria bacterium]|nr:hypothetical protein [Deltaproteobacteria bacterium]